MRIAISYFKKYKKEFFLLFVFTLLLAGITNIIPVLTQNIFELGVLNKNICIIISLTMFLIIMSIVKIIVNYIYEIQISKTANEIIMLEKNEIINKIIKMPLSFFDKYSPQYILSRINEINSISTLISSSVFNVATSILSMIFALIFIFYKNVMLGCICILFMGVVYFITNISMKQIGTSSRTLLEHSAQTNNKIHNVIQGLFTIKNLNREESIQKGIEKDIKELAKKSVYQQKLISKGTQITSGTITCVDLLLVGVIAYLVATGHLKLTDYISLTQYVSMVYTPLTILQSFKIVTKPAIVSLDRINNMLNQEEEEKCEGEEIESIDEILVENLHFKYNSEKEDILKNINFRLQKGDRLSLIGHNGSGKTTLIKLLMGYYSVLPNAIFYNGIDINLISKKAIRKNIGLIPQNIFLFNGTVYENIRVGNTEMLISDFENRLHLILSYGFLTDIELNKMVVDNGKNLSKGQIQQIAIVRILIKDYSVYIFDEATASLDKNSRMALYQYIKKEMKQDVCIFINHNDEFDDIINKKISLDNK